MKLRRINLDDAQLTLTKLRLESPSNNGLPSLHELRLELLRNKMQLAFTGFTCDGEFLEVLTGGPGLVKHSLNRLMHTVLIYEGQEYHFGHICADNSQSRWVTIGPSLAQKITYMLALPIPALSTPA